MKKMFNPESIVVIGASADLEKVSSLIIPTIVDGGFTGRLYAVHRRETQLHGVPTHASLDEIVEPIDLAVISVPSHAVSEVLYDCARRGIANALVYSSGFAEFDSKGGDEQDALREIAAKTGMRILGPNCQGFLVPRHNLCTSFNGVLARPEHRRDGGVAVIAQSGAVAGIVAALLAELGMGLRLLVSTGNEADVDFCDVASLALEDPGVQVICGYLEAIRDMRAFRRVAEQALAQGVPLVIMKGGTSARGADAARSHTGALAGDERVNSAIFAQLGVVSVSSLEELAAAAALLSIHAGTVRGDRVAILGNSGGTGVILADRCADVGLDVPGLTEALKVELGRFLPNFVTPSNPVDIPLSIKLDPSTLKKCILAFHESSMPMDAYLVCCHSLYAEDGYRVGEVVDSLVEAQDVVGVPVIVVPYGSDVAFATEAAAAGLCVVPQGDRAVLSLGQAVEWARIRDARAGDSREVDGPGRAPRQLDLSVELADRSLRDGDGVRLPEAAAKLLLAEAGVDVVRGRVVSRPQEAVEAAAELGYPVVMKLSTPSVEHKTDVGAVRLSVGDQDAVQSVFGELAQLAQTIDGSTRPEVLIEQEADAGLDVFVSIRVGPEGGLILLGAGGVLVEVLEDVAMRGLPVTEFDLSEMVSGLRIAPLLLRGARGDAPRDVDWLFALLLRLQEFMLDRLDVASIELNPVRLHASGQGGSVLDAVMWRRDSTTESAPVGAATRDGK